MSRAPSFAVVGVASFAVIVAGLVVPSRAAHRGADQWKLVRLSYAPTAINDRGLIVGHRGGLWALWDGANWRSIGSLGEFGQVTELNDAGQIAGWRTPKHGKSQGFAPSEAFAWESGRLTVLPTLGGSSEALAINDRSQVVGYSVTRSGAQHAVLWDHGRIVDLGARRGWGTSTATAINDRGEIVGETSSPTVARSRSCGATARRRSSAPPAKSRSLRRRSTSEARWS